MSFTYTKGIPNPPNFPSQDVPNMKINTDSIYDIINVDHFSFEGGGSPVSNIDGRHRQVSLANEAAPAIPAGIGGVLFANNPAPTNISWPFWENVSGTTQLISGVPNPIANGHTFLPGGIILQWGFVAIPANQAVVPFSVSFNSLPFSIQLTTFQLNLGNTVYSVEAIPAPTVAQFIVNVQGSGLGSLYWMAIGI